MSIGHSLQVGIDSHTGSQCVLSENTIGLNARVHTGHWQALMTGSRRDLEGSAEGWWPSAGL